MTDVILQVLPVKSIFIIFLTLSSLEPVKPGLPYYFGLFYELQNREKLLASWNYWGILCTSEAIGLHAPANRNQQVFLFTGIWFKVWFLVIIKNQFDLNTSAGSMGWLQVETWGKLLNYSTGTFNNGKVLCTSILACPVRGKTLANCRTKFTPSLDIDLPAFPSPFPCFPIRAFDQSCVKVFLFFFFFLRRTRGRMSISAVGVKITIDLQFEYVREGVKLAPHFQAPRFVLSCFSSFFCVIFIRRRD